MSSTFSDVGAWGLSIALVTRGLGRVVAIKMLTEGYSGNAEMLQRFYREASQTGALRHNNIVIVYDAGDQDGEPYIVMEYVEGEPLDKTIKRSASNWSMPSVSSSRFAWPWHTLTAMASSIAI